MFPRWVHATRREKLEDIAHRARDRDIALDEAGRSTPPPLYIVRAYMRVRVRACVCVTLCV